MRTQSQNVCTIRELKDRIERLEKSSSKSEKRQKTAKEFRDMLFVHQQQALFEDASCKSPKDELKKLQLEIQENVEDMKSKKGQQHDVVFSSDDLQRILDNVGHNANQEHRDGVGSALYDLLQNPRFKSPNKSGKSSAISCFSTSKSDPTANIEPKSTSLAISFSSPNLTTNNSFSSSSESELDRNLNSDDSSPNEGETSSVTKISNNYLEVEEVSSIDDNDAISGENDVDYEEVRCVMIPPMSQAPISKQKNQELNKSPEYVDDLFLSLALFDQESSNSSPGTNEISSSTHNRNSSCITSASVLDSLMEPSNKDISSIFSNDFNNLDTERSSGRDMDLAMGGCEREFRFFFVFILLILFLVFTANIYSNTSNRNNWLNSQVSFKYYFFTIFYGLGLRRFSINLINFRANQVKNWVFCDLRISINIID